MRVKVQFFSKLALSYGDRVLTQDQMHSDKMTKLLAFLIVNRNKSCTVQDIAFALWDNNDDINAAGAAKNLAWRLRKALRSTWQDIEFVITENGGYRWNPELDTELDMEQLSFYVRAAEDADSKEDKCNLLASAFSLYKGKVLSSYDSEHWIMPMTVYYQNMYITLAKELASLLYEKEDFSEMKRVCASAVSEEPLDESLRALLIKALISEGKYAEAEKMYHETTTLIYNTLGIGPSEELRKVYEESMKQRHNQEEDLSNVITDLKEAERGTGAYYCEYGVFKKIYELEARRQRRLGMTIYISLLTIAPIDEKLMSTSESYKDIIERGMDEMEDCILESLRSGDVVTRYSATQYLMMLPGCPYEMAERVMERIFASYGKVKRHAKIKYRYTLKEMQLDRLKEMETLPYALQPASIRVCLNGLDENMTMDGYLCGVALPADLRFSSTEELLRLLGHTLDSIGRPQSATLMRKFGKKDDTSTPAYQVAPEMYFTSEEIRSREGSLNTFDIQFLARQNSTWQGAVFDKDGVKKGEFSSELEMIGILTRTLTFH